MRRRIIVYVALAVVAGWLFGALQGDVLARHKKGKKEKEAKKEEVVKPVWPSPIDPGRFDAVFKELPFGKARPEFVKVLYDRFQEQIRPILRATLNATERDSLKVKMEETYEEVKKSYTEFAEKDSGYSVSVVVDEFAKNAGEAAYKYSYSDNAAYFFFSGDQLWKLFICAEVDVDFASLLVDLAATYGDPNEIIHEDEEKTVPVMATWEDTTFRFRAMRPEGIFVCSRLVWTYLPALPDVEKRRAAVTPDDVKEDVGENLLQQVLNVPGEEDPDVMDKILEQRKKEKK